MALLTRGGFFAITALALLHLEAVPSAAAQTRTALSGSCFCQSDPGSAGGTCQLLVLAQPETFDMTDVTVASTGSARLSSVSASRRAPCPAWLTR